METTAKGAEAGPAALEWIRANRSDCCEGGCRARRAYEGWRCGGFRSKYGDEMGGELWSR